MSLQAAILTLQLTAYAADAPQPWVEPTPAMHAEAAAPFRPRYPDVTSAAAIRDRDLALLRAALPQLDEASRSAAERALRARLERVRAEQGNLVRPAPDAPLEARVRAIDAKHVLDIEASTLELQLGLLRGAPDVPKAYDRVSVGDDVIVGADEVLRDAIAVGGDVIVHGRVLESAVAVLGDVVVMPGGVVDGETIVVMGEVDRPPDADPRPSKPRREPSPGAWATASAHAASALSLGGAGVLAVALFPAPVGRVASVLRRRPLASIVVGVFGSLAVLLGSALVALTLIGAPVALLGVAGLAFAWLLGMVAACEATADALGLPAPQGRWLALLVVSVALATLGLLPGLLQVLLVAGLVAGTGAALITRLGAAG